MEGVTMVETDTTRSLSRSERNQALWKVLQALYHFDTFSPYQDMAMKLRLMPMSYRGLAQKRRNAILTGVGIVVVAGLMIWTGYPNVGVGLAFGMLVILHEGWRRTRLRTEETFYSSKNLWDADGLGLILLERGMRQRVRNLLDCTCNKLAFWHQANIPERNASVAALRELQQELVLWNTGTGSTFWSQGLESLHEELTQPDVDRCNRDTWALVTEMLPIPGRMLDLDCWLESLPEPKEDPSDATLVNIRRGTTELAFQRTRSLPPSTFP